MNESKSEALKMIQLERKKRIDLHSNDLLRLLQAWENNI